MAELQGPKNDREGFSTMMKLLGLPLGMLLSGYLAARIKALGE